MDKLDIKYIKNAFKHFKKICIHKWWVFYYCCKAGMPLVGFMHDWSKFSPTEFCESVKYYVGTSSPIDECKLQKGYSMAWQKHKGRNFHHYEAWTDNYDSGTTSIEMPYRYVTEMFCDYIGAAKAYLGKDFTWEKEFKWWLCKKESAKSMHPSTKLFISKCFMYCKDYEMFPSKKIFKSIWNSIH